MRQIRLNNLMSELNSYVENYNNRKPLLLIFSSNELLDRYKAKILAIFNSRAYSILQSMPTETSDVNNFDVLVYHRYVEQFDEYALNKCVELSMVKPIICLTNDYEAKNVTPFADTNFDIVEILPSDPKKVVLISCSKQQVKGCHMAKDLYDSHIFRKSLQYAISLDPDEIFVLSTKYGLLPLCMTKKDYNVPKPENGWKLWSEKVLNEFKKYNLNPSRDLFVILAGKDYYQYLKTVIINIETPLEGLQTGYRLKKLNELLDIK